MEVVPGIHQLKVPIPDNPLGYLNSYLVQGEAGWLLVDTGWNREDAFRSLEAQLQGLGVGFHQIAQIVVTHVHPDHYGLMGRLKKLCPASFLLHFRERELLELRYIRYAELQAEMGALMAHHGVPPLSVPQLGTSSQGALGFVSVAMPDQVLQGGEVLSTGYFKLRVLWTPGHSPGHVCLYEATRKILFSGDHILPIITPNISYHIQSGPDPLADYLRSLEELVRLPVKLVLPAHEHPFANLKQRIDEITQHHDQRKGLIWQVLGKGEQTAWEVASQIPWDVPGVTWDTMAPLDKRDAVTEALAHLESLRAQGRVGVRERNGVARYHQD